MASPIRMGLDYVYSLGPDTIFEGVMQNTKTVRLGQAVHITEGGFEQIDATTERVLGPCVGIVQNGIPLDDPASSADFSGTWTGTQKKFESSDDNTTVDLVKIQVRIDPTAVYSMKLLGTIGTTRSSDEIGDQMSLSTTTSDRVDETTATTNPMTVMGLGLDPNDSTRLLGMFMETEIPRASQTADA